jgi:formylglycine-generating enzyme required for sulfatase activity
MKAIRPAMYALFALSLQGCEPTDAEIGARAIQNPSEIDAFIEEVKRDLVFVEGGEFLMGDFGPQGPEKLPYDTDDDSKPLHKVVLTSFSMDRFKVTNKRYQLFLASNNLRLRENGEVIKSKWDSVNAIPDLPAHIDWYEAQQYCQWLGELTKLPFGMPTEAQWEYAARSRGQYLMVATDDGDYKAEPYQLRTESYLPLGINISSYGSRVAFAIQNGLKTKGSTPLPVDTYPPNPLGIYSMSDNGYEWVKDWYDPDYYRDSPVNNPQGPEFPVFKDALGHDAKVVRGQSYANPYWGGGVNVFRTPADPLGRFNKNGTIVLTSKTMRCVVNSPIPVKLSSSSK